jgi:hypothetical protein
MVCIVFAFAIGCIIGAVVTIGIRIFITKN